MRLILCLGIFVFFVLRSAETYGSLCLLKKRYDLTIIAIKFKSSNIRLFTNVCNLGFTEEEVRAAQARHLNRINSVFGSKEEKKT